MSNTTTENGQGQSALDNEKTIIPCDCGDISAAQIGTVVINGESFPLIDGRNEIHGESVYLRDTHHFAYANMDYADRGWHFEPNADWARRKCEDSAAVYWASANPWA